MEYNQIKLKPLYNFLDFKTMSSDAHRLYTTCKVIRNVFILRHHNSCSSDILMRKLVPSSRNLLLRNTKHSQRKESQRKGQ